jgi:hypothetical protein
LGRWASWHLGDLSVVDLSLGKLVLGDLSLGDLSAGELSAGELPLYHKITIGMRLTIVFGFHTTFFRRRVREKLAQNVAKTILKPFIGNLHCGKDSPKKLCYFCI